MQQLLNHINQCLQIQRVIRLTTNSKNIDDYLEQNETQSLSIAIFNLFFEIMEDLNFLNSITDYSIYESINELKEIDLDETDWIETEASNISEIFEKINQICQLKLLLQNSNKKFKKLNITKLIKNRDNILCLTYIGLLFQLRELLATYLNQFMDINEEILHHYDCHNGKTITSVKFPFLELFYKN